MQRARHYRQTFLILCQLLNLKPSKLVRGKKPHMTKGLSLEVQSGMPGKRIQVMTHNGKGTGGNCFLYSRGSGEFESKVQAIREGLQIRAQVMANPKHWHAGDSIGGFRL